MQEPMGINKLANMFMGNPQPLAAKVEQAQKQTPPGQIPPDLKEALALQEIQEAQQHAQNQQAMQAGGQQPTVMEKLRQLTGTAAQPQAQPGMPPQMAQGQPQMPPQGMPAVQAAHGGSIAHLMSNLGNHYGGGGIVAFDGGGDVEGEPEYASVWRATKLAKDAKARKQLEEERARNMAMANAQPGEMRPVMQNDPRLMGATPAAESVGAPAAPAGLAQAAPQAAPVARPPAAQAPRPPVPQAAAPAADDLKTILRSDITNTLKRNPEEERDKGAEYYRKTVGLDALLAEQEARAAAREARYKESQESRTPEWVRGLQALGGPAVRGGLGMVLAQAGRGATAARDEYATSDAKFADEQDRLRDVITKAKIEGNTGVANAGIKALEQLRMDHQNARTSGTSLLNTEEMTAQRREQARQHNEAMAESRAARAGTAENKATIDAYKVRLASIDKELASLQKMPFGENKITIASLQAEKARLTKAMDAATGIGTMGAAPGAPSPGGTTTSGWGKAQVVK